MPADANNTGFATAPGATVSITNQTLPVAIPASSTFYLAWNYSVSTGTTVTNAQALAVDNISIAGVTSGGGDTAPSVSSTTPASGATNVAVNSTIVINFSESVTASASAFSLECPAGSPQTFTQTASPATTFTLTPNAPLPAGTTCAVTVTRTQVTDTDATIRRITMAADYTLHRSRPRRPADTAPFGDQHDAREWGDQRPGQLDDRHQLQRERDGEPDGVLDSVPGRRSAVIRPERGAGDQLTR